MYLLLMSSSHHHDQLMMADPHPIASTQKEKHRVKIAADGVEKVKITAKQELTIETAAFSLSPCELVQRTAKKDRDVGEMKGEWSPVQSACLEAT